MNVPVIDFADCGLLKVNDNDVQEESLFNAGTELYHALATVGFAYIVNTGIPSDIIDEMNKLSNTFFSLSATEKAKFSNDKLMGITYDPVGALRLLKDKPTEPLEGFRMVPWSQDSWPDIPGLKEQSIKFQDICKSLTHRLFKALGRGMKLKDKDNFFKSHELMNLEGNSTQLKFTHYPAMVGDIEENQIRLAEHTDYGSLTLLFLEEESRGLQIQSSNEKWVDVKPVPGGIILNVGDQLQYWTGGRLLSRLHRVVAPEDPKLRSKDRKSMVYFVHVDNKVLLQEMEFDDMKQKPCTNKQPMTAQEFMKKRFEETFY